MFDMKSAASLLAGALIAVAPVAAPLGGGAAHAASFDCAHAANATERAICANPSLSAIDSAMSLAYAQRLAANSAVRQIQRAWLAARNACDGHTACLSPLMSTQLAWLRSGAPRLRSALPTRVGACALTSVKRVTLRLEDSATNEPIAGSGSAVAETDGGYQVSYDTLPAVDASRHGDPVLVCLTSIPHPCPPGDTRGREYAVANLRTFGAWWAPDAEHMCGGA
jgi:uncharacterized protein